MHGRGARMAPLHPRQKLREVFSQFRLDGIPFERWERIPQVDVHHRERRRTTFPKCLLQSSAEMHQDIGASWDADTKLPHAKEERLRLAADAVRQPLGHNPAPKLPDTNGAWCCPDLLADVNQM